MRSNPFEHVLYQLINTPVKDYPFEHLYVEGVFPKDYYRELLDHLPANKDYTQIEKLGKVSKGHYLERFVFPLLPQNVESLPEKKKRFWQNFIKTFINKEFQKAALFLFSETIEERFGSAIPSNEFQWTVDLVRDTSNYSIGPHTDSPGKVISFLFYLPEDDTYAELGTSLFAPKDPAYADPVGKHHSFEPFNLITTMPFLPNTMFAFARTDTSWHGVLPIKEKVERNSLSFQLTL
jgi:hypothetical protein